MVLWGFPTYFLLDFSSPFDIPVIFSPDHQKASNILLQFLEAQVKKCKKDVKTTKKLLSHRDSHALPGQPGEAPHRPPRRSSSTTTPPWAPGAAAWNSTACGSVARQRKGGGGMFRWDFYMPLEATNMKI